MLVEVDKGGEGRNREREPHEIASLKWIFTLHKRLNYEIRWLKRNTKLMVVEFFYCSVAMAGRRLPIIDVRYFGQVA